jgi:flagellar hook-associated protein 1 FlgK
LRRLKLPHPDETADRLGLVRRLHGSPAEKWSVARDGAKKSQKSGRRSRARRVDSADAADSARRTGGAMSLSVALNVAVSGLLANQQAIAATSENIAKVNTADFARRESTFYAGAIPDQFAGVSVEIARAAVDRFLQAAAHSGSADAGASRAIADAFERIEATFGAPAENISYAHKLDEAFAALATLAANPSSLAAKADALEALDAAFAAFARTQQAVADEGLAAEARLSLDIERANALLADIHRLNQIVPDSAGAADLIDARLSELARLLSINVTRSELGQVSVAAADGTVIADAGGYAALGLTTGATATLTLSSVDPQSGALSLQLADFSAGAASGEIRGLLDLRNVELPRLAEIVGQAADGVAAALNGAYAANTIAGQSTPTADVLLLANSDGTYSVNPALLADPSRFAIARPAAGDVAGLNDGSGATALAFVASTSAASDVAQSIALVGSAARNAGLKAGTEEALAAEVSARLSAATGVNLDEELSNLILFQRAYSANARVIAAIDALWESLLQTI